MTGFSVRLPAGSPAWLVALAIVGIVAAVLLGELTTIARHMMPQDSSDRLVWWRERRALQAQRRTERTRGTARRRGRLSACIARNRRKRRLQRSAQKERNRYRE